MSDGLIHQFIAEDGGLLPVALGYLLPDGEITYETYATTYANDNPDSGEIELPVSLLRKGTNIIAVEVHNNIPGSSDLYWDAEISYNVTSGNAIVSRERALQLNTDEDTEVQAIFQALHPDCLVAAGSSPVIVNEVSANNTVAANEYGRRNDWIELYNTTGQDIDLEGMFLTDDPTMPEKYQITQTLLGGSTIIPAHGYFVVWADNLDPLRQLHTGFKLSNNNEESVTLTAADHSWSDCLTYSPMNGDESVGRYPDGGKRTYRMTRPTIDATNTLTSYSEWLYGFDENFDEETFLTTISQTSLAGLEGNGTEFFTIDGMKLDHPQRGINIVRTIGPDGKVSTKKLLVK